MYFASLLYLEIDTSARSYKHKSVQLDLPLDGKYNYTIVSYIATISLVALTESQSCYDLVNTNI